MKALNTAQRPTYHVEVAIVRGAESRARLLSREAGRSAFLG